MGTPTIRTAPRGPIARQSESTWAAAGKPSRTPASSRVTGIGAAINAADALATANRPHQRNLAARKASTIAHPAYTPGTTTGVRRRTASIWSGVTFG